MALVKLADKLAKEAHEGQKDKSGADYIEHPREVAKALARAGHDPETCVVALLHDVLEDTKVTAADLVAQGIPEDLVYDVIAVSFRYFNKRETREEYYARVRMRPRALAVKRADVAHNRGRLDKLEDPSERARLEKKYEKASRILG